MSPVLNWSFAVADSIFGCWTSHDIIKLELKKKVNKYISDKVINHSERCLALLFATNCLELI